MLPHLGEQFGNPSGAHGVARAARAAIEDARDALAEALGCDSGEIVFTGGGTEADNLAILGAPHGHRLCSAIEHHAVLHAVERAGGETFFGLDDLRATFTDDVSVVSMMLANNETGVVQPLDEVAQFVDGRALVHTDAVAAFNWLDVASLAARADLVTISAHKFGGPKGVGALVVRHRARLEAQLLGGGQERERRSGTHNVAGIVAMAAAATVAVRERDAVVARVTAWRDELMAVLDDLGDVTVTAADAPHTAGTLHVLVGGVESEALVIALDDLGVCVSAGSACASGALEPSHVLAAMGVDREAMKGALRLSMGWSTTAQDVQRAAAALPKAIEMLRAGA